MPNIGDQSTSKSGRPIYYTARGWSYTPATGGGKPQAMAGAEQRGRANLSLDPAVTALNMTFQMESAPPAGARGTRKVPNNPFSDEPFAHAEYTKAAAQDDGGPIKRQLATAMAGTDMNEEMNAYKQFESAIMPMFAGSAVTVSEAQRFLASNIPQPEDSAATINAKAIARKQLANGAARLVGAPTPYSETESWISGRRPVSAAPTRQPQATPRLKGPSGRAYTPAQVQAVRSIQGLGQGRQGAQTNPLMINTQAQYNAVPVGAWYIDHLGNYEQKVK
jgi:hypothetical protein